MKDYGFDTLDRKLGRAYHRTWAMFFGGLTLLFCFKSYSAFVSRETAWDLPTFLFLAIVFLAGISLTVWLWRSKRSLVYTLTEGDYGTNTQD
jgi:uncharacterized membrane protein YccC